MNTPGSQATIERLGNITNNSSAPPGLLRKRARFAACRVLVKRSTLARVRACGHTALGNLVSVRVGQEGNAAYGRLMMCGSVWACPVCSARILWERTRDVSEAMERWESDPDGGGLALITLTVRHNQSDSLKDVWALVGKAWSNLTSGRRWARISARMGMEGWLRAVEVTHGKNGWHVHLHILAFLGRDHDFTAGSSLMLQTWVTVVERLGGSALVGVQDARLVGQGDAVAAYLSKNVYAADPESVALEVTRGDLKVGAGRSPFQILEVAMGGPEESREWALWAEWEAASFRKRQHTWKQGFRDRLGLGEARSDEEAASDEDNEDLAGESVEVCWLTRESWLRVRASDSLYWGLLDAAAAGKHAAYLDGKGMEWLGAEDGYRFYFEGEPPPAPSAVA